jgi:CheY-like chemotaxis protein/HPt (histidine-containing phosphotransfer) domain-containing protein
MTMPLVMLSSFGWQNKTSLREIGFTDFLTKPIKPTQLFQSLNNILGKQEIKLLKRAGELAPEVVATVVGLDILVVEDNQVNSDIAKIILKKYGHQVTIVENGLQSLQLLLDKSFDLIFMDIQMPVMDGMETISVIRKSEKGELAVIADHAQLAKQLQQKLLGQKIPIVVLTANAMQNDINHYLDIGATAHLTKPFKQEQMMTVMQHVMGNRASKEEGESVVENRLKTTNNAKRISANPKKYRLQAHAHLKRELGMDDEQITDVLKTLSSPLKATLRSVDEAHQQQDLTAIAETAHSLKGALLNLGLDELAELAKTIEKSAATGEQITHKKRLAYLHDALRHI